MTRQPHSWGRLQPPPCVSFQTNTASARFVKTATKTKPRVHMWVKKEAIHVCGWTTVIHLVCPGLIRIRGCIRVHPCSLYVYYSQRDLLWGIDSCDDDEGWKVCRVHVPVLRLEAAVEPGRADIPMSQFEGLQAGGFCLTLGGSAFFFFLCCRPSADRMRPLVVWRALCIS